MKVLFDSNIHISDAIFGGAAGRAIDATVDARWKIFISESILAEMRRVICDKFNRTKAFANSVSHALRENYELADEPRTHHQVPGDPNDTPILRAALAAGVDYLVTRDAKLLALNPTESIRIITLTDYLHILQDHGYALD